MGFEPPMFHYIHDAFEILGAVATVLAAVYAWRAYNEARPTSAKQLRAWRDWLTYAVERPGSADLVDRPTPLSDLVPDELAAILRRAEIANRHCYEVHERGVVATLGAPDVLEREEIQARHYDLRADAVRRGAADLTLLDEAARREMSDFDLQSKRLLTSVEREMREELREIAKAMAEEALTAVGAALTSPKTAHEVAAKARAEMVSRKLYIETRHEPSRPGATGTPPRP